MISLYLSNETEFNTNGIYILNRICKKATVTENLQGLFNFSATFHLTEESKFIKTGMIIKAPTPKGEQLFRVNSIQQSITEVQVQANHIINDLNYNFIDDIYPQKMTGSQALPYILEKAKYKHRFTASSDITRKSSSRLVRKNLLSEAILSGDNSFIVRWGGEISFDNFHLTINESFGEETNIVIEYGRDIKGFDISFDETEVVTVIEPRGFDDLKLDEVVINSPYINDYPFKRHKVIKFDNVRVFNKEQPEVPGIETEEEAKQELRRLTQNLFDNGIDRPAISIKINFLDFYSTEQGKKYSSMKKMSLGDTITVKIDKLNLLTKQRLIEYSYDSLSCCYLTLSLGEKKKNIFDELTLVTGKVEDFKDRIGSNTINDIIEKTKVEINNGGGTGGGGTGGGGTGGCDFENKSNSEVILRRNELILGNAKEVSQMDKMIIGNKNGIGFAKGNYNSMMKINYALSLEDSCINAEYIKGERFSLDDGFAKTEYNSEGPKVTLNEDFEPCSSTHYMLGEIRNTSDTLLITSKATIGSDCTVEGDCYANNFWSETTSVLAKNHVLNNTLCTESYITQLGGSTIGQEGFVICLIDFGIQEVANFDIQYHVFTQIYAGEINKIIRYENYFIVYGKEGTEFSWEIKAKRKDYEEIGYSIEDRTLEINSNSEFNTIENILKDEINNIKIIEKTLNEELKNNLESDYLLEKINFKIGG